MLSFRYIWNFFHLQLLLLLQTNGKQIKKKTRCPLKCFFFLFLYFFLYFFLFFCQNFQVQNRSRQTYKVTQEGRKTKTKKRKKGTKWSRQAGRQAVIASNELQKKMLNVCFSLKTTLVIFMSFYDPSTIIRIGNIMKIVNVIITYNIQPILCQKKKHTKNGKNVMPNLSVCSAIQWFVFFFLFSFVFIVKSPSKKLEMHTHTHTHTL